VGLFFGFSVNQNANQNRSRTAQTLKSVWQHDYLWVTASAVTDSPHFQIAFRR
jgi:hypothetical protein